MNRIPHIMVGTGLLVLTSAPLSASELSTILLPQDQEIQLALEAGPKHIRSATTVYVFENRGYKKVRTGTNGFTCMVNRDGNQNGDNDLKPTCWDAEGSRTIVPVMLRVGELIAEQACAADIKKDIDAGFASGKYLSPRKAGIAYMLKGDLQFDPKTQTIVKTLFPPHYMIYAPGVTNKDIGMDVDSRNHDHALPRVYDGYSGGTHIAYIIVLAKPDGR